MKTFSDLKGGDFLYKICNKKVTKEEVCSTYKYPSGMIYTTLMCDLPFEAPKSKSVFKAWCHVQCIVRKLVFRIE